MFRSISQGTEVDSIYHAHTAEYFPESCSTKRNLDCKDTFLIDLLPNGIPLGASLYIYIVKR